MLRLFSVFFCLLLITSCGVDSSTSSGSTLGDGKSQGVQVQAPTLLWGRYQAYSRDLFALAQKESDRKILLFFQDATCATCRDTTLSIIRTMNKVPGVKSIGFKVQQGTDLELEKKYAVKKAGTLILLAGDKELARREGAIGEAELLGWIKGK